MTNEKLEQATELSQQIKDLEKIIKNCENQTCEWVEFTFGNGSDRQNVCNDSKIIERLRGLIIQENKIKLNRLKKEFSKL